MVTIVLSVITDWQKQVVRLEPCAATGKLHQFDEM